MSCEYTLRRNKIIAAYETKLILDYLFKWDWNVSHAAKDLGIDRSNLSRKMRQLGIKRGMTRYGQGL